MSTKKTKAFAVAMDSLFEQERWPEQAPSALQVREALREDESLRERYDALALADRALSASQPDVTNADDDEGSPLGQFERQFMALSFEQALDAQLEQEGRVEAAEPTTKLARVIPWVTGFSVAASALFAAGALWVLNTQSTQQAQGQQPQDVFEPRGIQHLPTPTPSVAPIHASAMLYCLEGSGDTLKITGADEAPFGLLVCPLDAQLKLGYTNPERASLYMASFGVSEAGRLFWYGPSPASPAALKLEQTQEIQPVGPSVKLEINHAPGVVRVYTVFSPEPISYAMLEELVRDQPAQALFEGQLSMLPEHHITSTTFEVEVARPR